MDFLDSNIIAYAFYSNKFTEKCQEVIKKGGVTNTFVLIEAFHILGVNKEVAERSIRSLLKSNIQIINVDVNLLFESLKRINKYKLSIFDMVHYTCALLNKCDKIISYDGDFNNLQIPRYEPV